MARELRPIDIGSNPELLRLAEEVLASGEGRLLRRADQDLVAVLPLARLPRKRSAGKSEADLKAFRSAAGGWSDIDTDKLVEDVYESRRSSRPAVNL